MPIPVDRCLCDTVRQPIIPEAAVPAELPSPAAAWPPCPGPGGRRQCPAADAAASTEPAPYQNRPNVNNIQISNKCCGLGPHIRFGFWIRNRDAPDNPAFFSEKNFFYDWKGVCTAFFYK
jgi:hypothetical protein